MEQEIIWDAWRRVVLLSNALSRPGEHEGTWRQGPAALRESPGKKDAPAAPTTGPLSHGHLLTVPMDKRKTESQQVDKGLGVRPCPDHDLCTCSAQTLDSNGDNPTPGLCTCPEPDRLGASPQLTTSPATLWSACWVHST